MGWLLSYPQFNFNYAPDVHRVGYRSNDAYLNVIGEQKEIPMKRKSKSILFGKEYSGNFIIATYQPEFIETRERIEFAVKCELMML